MKHTKEQFIEKAKQIHGDKYDYSKVEYVNCDTKVCIICPTHGEFWQTPYNHTHGAGCVKCHYEEYSKMYSLTTEEFIEKAKKVHGDKYDYSKVNYINNETKVCIVCPKHGEFLQLPINHLKGHGCRKCMMKKLNELFSHSKEEFIEKAKKVHGDKYNYSKVVYINALTKVCIICPTHGEFWQTPSKHLLGQGCNKCGTIEGHIKQRKTKEQFIEEAKQIHGDKYDYSKVEYHGVKKKVCIICPTHGEFWQTPDNHIQGNGCKKCSNEKLSKENTSNTEEFVKKSKEVHNDKYDYSKVKYVNNKTKVCIICPKHGEFWQAPNNHINGNGCPVCKESKLEIETRNSLIENKIEFTEQQTFDWLKYENNMFLDFFIPSKNIAIECQGIQHFKENEYFNGKEGFELTQKRDKLKKKLCDENGVKIIYYSNLGIEYPYEVEENISSIISLLKNNQ